MAWKIMQGDVRDKLAGLPDGSVQCVITSPPYWGLRDYNLPPSVWGGDKDCKHEWAKVAPRRTRKETDVTNMKSKQASNKGAQHDLRETDVCQKCGAWLGCLGLEPTPELYVQNMVEVFRGVWRVLRDDGVVWLNLGDSYAGSNQGVGTKTLTAKQASNRGTVALTQAKKSVLASVEGLKPKDLVGIPWRVAFALQADGWWLRSDIIWHKLNPMPESVTDRPTKAHEYIFLLTKKQKYFYDAEAVKEPKAESSIERYNHPRFGSNNKAKNRKDSPYAVAGGDYSENEKRETGRNKRTVWTVSTQPYPEAHFATFPPKLIEPCILAGTSPRACEICGAPWERIIKRTGHINKREPAHVPNNAPTKTDSTGWRPTTIATDNWQPTCACENEGTGRCIVLDPFAGSGTTLWVAEHYGRDSIGIELSEEYVKLVEQRMTNFQQTIFNLAGVQ